MQPLAGTRVVDNASTQVFWCAERVLCLRIKGARSLDDEDAEQLFAAFDELGVTAATALLADIRTLRGVTLGVRKRMASTRAAGYLAVVALVADNALTRTIGNFFVRLNRPPFPMRIFDTEAQALTWLLTQAPPCP